MFPNFRIWTTRNETQLVSNTTKSRRARAAPYPTRLAPAEGHPLEDSRKLVRPKVPKPMLNFEMTEALDPLVLNPVPSENQEPDVVARSATDPLSFGSLIPSPGPPETQEPDAPARPAIDQLAFGPLVPEIQEPNVAARLVPDPLALVLSAGPPEIQEPNVNARPAPNPLAFGLPENQELDVADTTPDPLAMSNGPSEKPIEPNAFSPPEDLPAPPSKPIKQFQFNFNSAHNSSQSPTSRLDLRKCRAKRQYNEDTPDKTRLIVQPDLMTRVALQEKDHMIELLKNELVFHRKNTESLLQKVDSITEELKTKDKLLERAEGQARAENSGHRLPPSPLPLNLTGYEDEDVYMGDNEADKLREDRRCKKGLVQQDEVRDSDTESYKRTIRKKKGKNRQIEDEETENTSESGGAQDEGIDDSERGSDDEAIGSIDINDKVEAGPSSWPSSVPPPYKFSKPKGGAGPRLKAQIPPNTASNSESDDDPPQAFNTIPNPLNLPHDALAALTRTVLGVIGQRDDLLACQMKRRRITSQKIKQPTVRASKTRRKELGAMCRKDMNTLLEIGKDKDIVLKTPPSDEVVEAFAEERGPGPVLNPMRFSFNVTAKHAWNIDLAEQFVDQFMSDRGIGKDEEPLIYELFTTRFGSLKRRYREWQFKEGEDAVQRAQRVKEMHRVERRMRRRDTRRNNLFADRSQIALDNRVTDVNGTVDPAWDFLYKTTRLLRSEGMSSDESGQEGSGPPYYIKTRDWRNKDLIPYLQKIDRDKKRTNAYGNNRPGNPPRERQRLSATSTSDRKAIPDLPINFYDKTWYADLSRRDRALLRPGAYLNMPALVAYD